MQEFITNLIGNSNTPIISAFLLGLLTAISPCPMATNITAIGFISRDVESRRKVFYNGLIYTLGKAIAYTLLAIIIFIGADQMKLSGWFQLYGEKILGPILILVGILMLDLIPIKFPGFNKISEKYQNKTNINYLEVLLLGILFALSFCPYSGVLYFGMLIPMSIGSVSGLYLPIVFAIGTALPVIIIAWLLAFTVSGVGKFYSQLKAFEKWFRRVIAIVFIGVGIYYIIIIYFIK